MAEQPVILLVDDEKRFRETSRRLLNRVRYEVILAENGRVALDLLSRNSVDVILLDLKMPVMGGEEFLKTMLPAYPHIPVIIITGHGSMNMAVDCMTRGAYYFISKPVDFDLLVLTIERALEKKRLEEQAKQLQEETVRNLLELNTEKKKLETIIHCLANGVMVTNKNMEVILHNPALLRLLDISEEIPNPVPVSEIIRDNALIETLYQIQEGKIAEQELVSQEIFLGSRVLRAISAPALASDRNVFWAIAGAVTVLEDITPFKELDLMKTDFVNMVAHELRSPLVAIRQLNSVLAEGLAGPLQQKQQEFVEKGMKKIDALLGLIHDLLDVAKLEDGKLLQHAVPVDIGAMVEEMVTLMQPRAKKQGIALSFSCENLRPITADPRNMEEILNNLLSNALNYSPEGGNVTVTAKGAGEFMEITVSDTGVGIASEELPKIFEKFYRVKHPKTRQVPGTGLGLSLVKGIVEAHHGTVDVESVLDKGTTFTIRLPMAKEESHP
jgi:two-component system phosphate regulon sensor histidine kinase PhoR